jgi:acetyl esterase/lipase
MHRVLAAISMAFLIAYGASGDDSTVAPDQIISVWPESPPAWNAPDQPERNTSGPDSRTVAGKSVIRLGFVSKPELHVFRPKGNDSDTAILICPGGGYSILAWDLEGTEIAQWLQGLGVTAIVVKYRVPTRSNETRWLAPVQDIQRGISLVRSGAIEGLAPKRIGVLGFSAGGNASARVATAQQRHYEPVDKSDDAAVRPDFAVLVYPAWLVDDDVRTKLLDEIVVNEKSPPTFFAHAADDRVTCMSSVTMFGNLEQSGVPSSLHVFSSGGHGFGGRVANLPTDAWRELCATWMKSHGWLKP